MNIWDRLYTKPSTIYSAWPVANNLFNEWLAAIDKNAIRHFAGSSYKVHLDVACGTGRLFDPGLARFYIGVDASLPALILAKRRLPRTTTDFVQGVAESLPFKDDANCIELTICYGLLEYVENQSALIRELRRVSGEKAMVLATFPRKASYPFVISSILVKVSPVRARTNRIDESPRTFRLSVGPSVSLAYRCVPNQLTRFLFVAVLRRPSLAKPLFVFLLKLEKFSVGLRIPVMASYSLMNFSPKNKRLPWSEAILIL